MSEPVRRIQYTTELPLRRPFRWTALRKLALIEAVRRWPEERAALIAAYGVGEDELAAWERGWDGHGLIALRATRVQKLAREART